MSESTLALVTGATGVVGPPLVRLLVEEGYRVRVLLRSEPEPGLLPPGVEPVRGDLTDPSALREAVRGAGVVFHLAARLHVNAPGPELAAAYERVNAYATADLARAAREAGADRFVYFSTINVYGPGAPGVLYTEADPPTPDTLYGRTKLDGERAALREHPGATVLRLAAVYGPRMRGNYPLLLRALRAGAAVMIGDGRNRRTLVYVDDVARAAVLAARHPAAVGATFNVTDGEPHRFDEILRAMQRALGRREGVLYVPAAPLRSALAGLARGGRAVGLRAPVGPEAVDKLTEDMAVSGRRLQEVLGFAPAYDLGHGWREAVRQR